jgi:hypothetical protein
VCSPVSFPAKQKNQHFIKMGFTVVPLHIGSIISNHAEFTLRIQYNWRI